MTESDCAVRTKIRGYTLGSCLARVLGIAILGAVCFGLQFEANRLFFLLGKILCGAYLIGTTILAVGFVIRAPRSSCSYVMSLVMILLTIGYYIDGTRIARVARFYVLKSEYTKRVAVAQARLRDRHNVESGSPDVLIERADGHVRVAFVWPGGLLDNWYGVVFDSTDELASACDGDRRVNERGAGRHVRLKRWFGGDLIHCERIEGQWYFCWFT